MLLPFQPFVMEHRPIIDSYFKAYPFDCSEFTFTNVMMWGQDDKIKWAEHNDVLYIQLKFVGHAPFLFPPIPKNKKMNYGFAVDAALRHFYALGEVPRFRSVSGPFVRQFQKCCSQFTLAADRNTFDYVYRAEDLIFLAGRKYHAKRNHINQFSSQYDYTYRAISADMAEECMALYGSWLEEKDITEPGILGEMKAIQFLLPNIDALGVKAGGIFIGDKLVAFSVGERIRDDMAVIHIEKADPAYPAVFAVINQQFAQHAWNDVTYINREEDMGIPGMRKAKLSYRPDRLIEKYDVVWRP